MQLARLGLAALCASLGYLARVGMEPAAQAAPPAVVPRAAAVPVIACAAGNAPRDTAVAARDPVDVADDDPDDPGDDGSGEDLGEALARAAASLPAYPNRMHGVVTYERGGEVLAGTTVIAVSPALAQSRVAITDDRGEWTMTDLPPGNYTVTFYYGEMTLEHANIALGSVTELELPEQLDDEPSRIVNIPVPGRTFESALGAADDHISDGVSFSSNDTLENTYYIDGVAVE